MKQRVANRIWAEAAELLGWEYSPAYAGWVHPNHIRPGSSRSDCDGYPSDVSAEEACFQDGIETLDQAVALIGGMGPC